MPVRGRADPSPLTPTPHPSRRERGDPLAGVQRLFVDGTNLLYALARARGTSPSAGTADPRRSPSDAGAPPPAPATLIGRLRAVVPPEVSVVLVFDGPPERGLGTSRLASGLTVRFAGRESADRLLERLVAAAPAGAVVVTDDRELATSIRRLGATTLDNGWLARQLARQHLASPAPGRPRPSTRPADGGGPAALELARDREAARRPWAPGRGATRKRGNPKRGHGAPHPDRPA